MLKLGVHENHDLLGNSWRGALALLFIVALQPRGLRRLILANSYASMALCEAGCRKLIEKLLKEIRETSEGCEREGKTRTQEYKDAELYFIQRHANIRCADMVLTIE